ncbi:DUF418 domain-containing protein [Bacillus sp. REN3]|uniref:DUF418 domain-containing protein n=1 Tax=Bacillus sp. REN3 TaxID=2802440 RepID=UPI001AEE3BBE|nr:DUF418 domain-containing protein [Bacillus sp. REN3]
MQANDRPGGNRIVSIDRMRGFSLLGIFLVNMISFHSPFFYIDPGTWWDGTSSRITYKLIDLFVQASFYPLFAMLFGYGLVILRERTLDKGMPFYPIAFRRLSILLSFGIVHAFLIWSGDILITYAICGFVFLFFIDWGAKRLLFAGLALYIIPNLLLLMMLTLSLLAEPNASFSIYDREAAEQAIEIYQTGSFMEITEQRIKEWDEHHNIPGLLFYLITILPLFLIGAAAAKWRLFENVSSKKQGMASFAVVMAAAGLLLKVIPYLTVRNIVTDYAQDTFGGPLLSVSYALWIALASENRKMDRLFAPLEAAGRLSISHYLFQSVFSTMIFYSYGLGYFGKVSLFEGTMLAIGIYTIQLAASGLWVRRFFYGPVEWLWRSGTYMKKQPLKRGGRI